MSNQGKKYTKHKSKNKPHTRNTFWPKADVGKLMDITVRCDKCQFEFHPRVKQLEFREQDKIVVNGFVCPKCNQRYITLVTDNNIRRDLAKLEDLHQEVKRIKRQIENESKEQINIRGYVPQDILDRQKRQYDNRYKPYIKLREDIHRRAELLKRAYLNRGKH